MADDIYRFHSYIRLNSTYDYNYNTLAPVGCAVLSQENIDQCSLFRVHSIHGWYTVIFMDNYQECKIMTKETNTESI